MITRQQHPKKNGLGSSTSSRSKSLSLDTLPFTTGRNNNETTLDIDQPLERELLSSENPSQQYSSKQRVPPKIILVSILIFVAGIFYVYNSNNSIKTYIKINGSFMDGEEREVSRNASQLLRESVSYMSVNQSNNTSKSPANQHSSIRKFTAKSVKKNVTHRKKPKQLANESSALGTVDHSVSASNSLITSKKTNYNVSLPHVKNFVLNPGFEDGSISGWNKFGNVNVNVVTSLSAPHGSYVTLITGRTENWHGISQDIGSRLIEGVTYVVSAFVQLDSAPHDVKIRFREGQGGSYNYKNAVSMRVDNAYEWIKIQGSYTASKDKHIQMNFEASSGVNLLIDNASVVEVEDSTIPVALSSNTNNNFIISEPTSYTTENLELKPDSEDGLISNYHSSGLSVVCNGTSCVRRCDGGLRNRIVWKFKESFWKAGLSDRLSIIGRLAELGAFLCARVYVPIPAELLDSGHNGGKHTDDSLRWKDFVTFVNNDGQQMVYDLLGGFSVDLSHMEPVYNILDMPSNRRSGAGTVISTIWTKSKDEVAPHYDLALGTTRAGRTSSFLWIIEANWWLHINDQLEGHLNDLREDGAPMTPNLSDWGENSRYVKSLYPEKIKVLATTMISMLRARSAVAQSTGIHTGTSSVKDDLPLLGLLHIRRGDTTDVCDTSLNRMKDYISCTFNIGTVEQRVMNGTHHLLTLLLMSDETSKEYRNDIVELFSKQGYIHAIFVDELAQNLLLEQNRENNYLTFQLLQALRELHKEKFAFQIALRRSGCPDCHSWVNADLRSKLTGSSP